MCVGPLPCASARWQLALLVLLNSPLILNSSPQTASCDSRCNCTAHWLCFDALSDSLSHVTQNVLYAGSARAAAVFTKSQRSCSCHIPQDANALPCASLSMQQLIEQSWLGPSGPMPYRSLSPGGSTLYALWAVSTANNHSRCESGSHRQGDLGPYSPCIG